MVITAACLGLRVSEVLGLQWGDTNFDRVTVTVQRSFVEGEVCPTKTEASEGILPLDADLADTLLQHRTRVTYTAGSDDAFAGATGKPRWPDIMLADYTRPVATKAAISRIGWHTFRDTDSTLLHAVGTSPTVQKELLRHTEIQTTLNVYTHAMTPDKREAASKVASALWKM
jgi:integrase